METAIERKPSARPTAAGPPRARTKSRTAELDCSASSASLSLRGADEFGSMRSRLITSGVRVNEETGERRSLIVSAILIRMDHVRAGRSLEQKAADLSGIARRIIAARKAKGLRPIDLSVMAGLGRNTVGNWETAAKRPSIDQLARALPVLEVTADWIYFGDDRALAWPTREAIFRELEKLPDVITPSKLDKTG